MDGSSAERHKLQSRVRRRLKVLLTVLVLIIGSIVVLLTMTWP